MGLAIASVRAQTALTAVSAEKLLGMGKSWGGEFNSFDDPFSLGFWDVHSVAPKVFRSAANVTTGDAIE